MHVAVIDIGTPGKNLGWAMSGPTTSEGTDLDKCIEVLATALDAGPLALGFEAPMFVPIRSTSSTLMSARTGECGNGISRAFSATPGATALVTGLVIVPYVLAGLRNKVPLATATLDWQSPLTEIRSLLLFEAFVTNQRDTNNPQRHINDARLAVAAFQHGMHDPGNFESSVIEPNCLNLLGANLLRTGWTTDLTILEQSCLVVKIDAEVQQKRSMT